MTSPPPIADAHAFFTRTSGEVETVVQGRSMRPAIPDGTTVRVRFGAVADWAPGSIVAFTAQSGWIIHRVVYQGRRGPAAKFMLTRGDNRTLPDGPVARERVVGLVTAMRVNDDWVPPPAPVPPPLMARLSVGLLGNLLEVSPPLASALSNGVGVLRGIYVSVRRGVARLLGRGPA